MPIYTKKGDKGETSLPGKRRLPKNDPIFDVLGNLDQTNACIGVAVGEIDKKYPEIGESLLGVQGDLLEIGACLAAETPKTFKNIDQLDQKIAQFESLIDDWEQKTGTLQNFILPGGARAGATLHLARTLSRQAERSFHRLNIDEFPEVISRYLNRLSDFLFQAARMVNFLNQHPEQIWKNF